MHRLQLNFTAADAIKPSPGLGSFHEHDNASLRVHDFSCTWLVQCKTAGHVLEARVQWLRTELHFDTVELFKSGMAATSSSLPTEFTLFAAAFDGPPRADIPLVHPWGLKPTVNTGTELRIEPRQLENVEDQWFLLFVSLCGSGYPGCLLGIAPGTAEHLAVAVVMCQPWP